MTAHRPASPPAPSPPDFLLDLAQGEVAGGGAAVAAAANGGGKDSGGGGELIGQPAITALWSTYEDFARRHKQGFTQQAQLSELTLLLEPPAKGSGAGGPKGGLAASAGADGGKGPHSSASGVGARGSGPMRALSSMLRRGSANGRSSSGGGGDSDEEDAPYLTREITRVFSKGAAADVEVGGCGAAVRAVNRALGTADRGGAGYWMQLKVRGGGAGVQAAVHAVQCAVKTPVFY